MCSATLHSFDVKKLSEKIMHFPTWVDLKGEDSVPDTVHHVVVPVTPKPDRLWERLGKSHIRVSALQRSRLYSVKAFMNEFNVEFSVMLKAPRRWTFEKFGILPEKLRS